jgi:enediyne biosynthesis protein CalE5
MEAQTVVQPYGAMWAAVAPAWGRHADYVDQRAAGLTGAMLAFAAPAPGERVLELACGAGGLGLAAAATGAQVVLSDVAEEMIEIAAARARARGLDGVATRVLDLDRLAEPGASYDVVLCREGMMFAGDPAAAAHEIHRVLRPGGRAAVAVWGPRAGNPWLAVVLDAASAQLGRAVPPPGVPGPFTLADSAAFGRLFAGAGLEVAVTEVPVPLRVGSFDEWWTRTTALAGPLAGILAALPRAAAEAVRSRAREAAASYRTSGGLEFPGVALLASATRPLSGGGSG